jgi:hemoglobin/transferrin/lactoferrin receptor protein
LNSFNLERLALTLVIRNKYENQHVDSVSDSDGGVLVHDPEASSQQASRSLRPPASRISKDRNEPIVVGAVMGCWTRSARALLIGISTIALMKAGAVSCAYAQSAEPAGATVTLDPVTVVATKTRQRVSDTLAPVSTVRATPVQAPQPAPQQRPGGPAAGGPPAPGGQLRSTTPVGPGLLQQLMPTRTADVFFGMPGVWTQTRGDEPGTAINIRGLQDFGRVAVLIDGARQNFQRSGHNADGQFYLDPEMIGGVDVVRGPVANIYGSGAIGGVVSFRTKDIEDVVRAGERWGVLTTGMVGSNILKGMGSVFAGAHVTPDIDIFGGAVYRTQTNYRDGDGKEWPNTGSNVASGIGKLTIRPADGHEVKFTGLTYETTYLNGQPTATLVNTATIYDTRVQNDVAAARWRYSRPDDQLFDFDANVYWTRTATDQQKISGTGNAITGFIGDKRRFAIDTNGFDINNTSRADWGPVHHALTYGGDSFQDQVSVTDPTGTGDLFTPNGRRTVSGNFVQLRTTYAPWIETIIASRYDTYKLDGGGFTSSGERTSPKATLGVTPLRGFTVYGTYAEGYRAPAVTETLIAGNHPPVGGPPFGFLPNPLLRPEVGKNKEVGVNLRYDDIATKGDAFRGKFNYYRNDLSDFIELTFIAPPCLPMVAFCFQYRNIPSARIEGWEFDTNYDAGYFFLGFAGSHVRGRNTITGVPLLKIPPDQYATTVGARFLDRKLTLAVRWLAVNAKLAQDIPNSAAITGNPDLPPTGSYNLVNLYAGYQPTPDVTWALSVENLLNVQYAPYLNAYASGSNVLPFPSPGITVKGSLAVRLGGPDTPSKVALITK